MCGVCTWSWYELRFGKLLGNKLLSLVGIGIWIWDIPTPFFVLLVDCRIIEMTKDTPKFIILNYHMLTEIPVNIVHNWNILVQTHYICSLPNFFFYTFKLLDWIPNTVQTMDCSSVCSLTLTSRLFALRYCISLVVIDSKLSHKINRRLCLSTV